MRVIAQWTGDTTLAELERELAAIPAPAAKASAFAPHLPPPTAKRPRPATVQLFRRLPQGRIQGRPGLWLRPGVLREVARSFVPKVWWWLPPVIWPDEETQWMSLMNDLLPQHQRSRILPLWSVAGFITGAVPGLLGPTAVFATVAAVETFVDRHY